jgi:phosphoribosylformimino-5-aminoimidazole carboxamide ribotide isomerase
MILFPAIDIKNGACVRLRQGRAEDVTVFSTDPAAMARHWAGFGISWLHVVDLDGAFTGKPVNAALVAAICGECSKHGVRVQLGGGIRNADTVKTYLDAGVSRCIIGTVALEEPETFSRLCSEFPGMVGVSLDADNGRLKTKGWVEDAGLSVLDVLSRLEEQGTAFIIYTDISRDGMQSGVNVPALENLLENTRLPVLAAGGVATLDDLMALYPLCAKGLEGAISGRAIYEGTLDVQQAMRWIQRQQQQSQVHAKT